jgi:drug/metabolite transporter (DMT)-like permease
MPPNSGALPTDRVMAGIGLGVLAYSLFSLHDATNKWLVAALPVWQVLFCRSFVIVIGCIAIGRVKLLTRAIETPLKGPLALRGGITLSAWMCYFTASRSMPLAQLLTLYFSSPILTTLMAIPLLGERVTRSRWICVFIGFTGAVVASDPFGVRATPATALLLIAAGLWGYGVILMRQIARREPSLLQMFYQNLVYTAVTGALTATNWEAPTGHQAVLLLAVGVLGGIGQFCMFEGARLAPASVMATVEYTSLLWAFLLGYLIWGDIPTFAIFAGAGLILFSGLLMLTGEHRRARALANANAPM